MTTKRQAVVLAGGLATRMRPLTDTVPKAMLEVAGRPFVEHLLEKLAGCGFDEALLLLGRFGQQIIAHVGDGARFGIRVRYSDEGESQLGTSGALRHALALLEPTFLITYGDSYLPFDYAGALEILRAHDDCDGVMAVYANENKWDASNVVTDGTWVKAYVKGTKDPAFDHIDYGAMALRREIIAALPEGKSALDVVQHEVAAAGRMRAYVARERFFEIGSKDGLATLDTHLRGLAIARRRVPAAIVGTMVCNRPTALGS